MKKLDSIELLHANGDSTIIDSIGIFDLRIEDVVEDWEINEEGGLERSFSCNSLELAILYNTNDEDLEVIKALQEQKDIFGFVLSYKKKKKVKEFDLPYIEESEEDLTNILQLVHDIDMTEITEEVLEEGDRLLLINISIENLEFEDEGVD